MKRFSIKENLTKFNAIISLLFKTFTVITVININCELSVLRPHFVRILYLAKFWIEFLHNKKFKAKGSCRIEWKCYSPVSDIYDCCFGWLNTNFSIKVGWWTTSAEIEAEICIFPEKETKKSFSLKKVTGNFRRNVSFCEVLCLSTNYSLLQPATQYYEFE